MRVGKVQVLKHIGFIDNTLVDAQVFEVHGVFVFFPAACRWHLLDGR